MRTVRTSRTTAVVLSLLLLDATALFAQARVQSVSGVVRDGAEVPLAGADVAVGAHHATTNAQGAFRVDSLTAGQYPLTVRLLGYAPVHSHVVVLEQEPTLVELYLARAAIRLSPMVVEASRAGIFGTVGDTAYHIADGARVQLLGPHRTEVRTDSRGKFGFPGVGDGQYMVRVTYPGFTERRLSVELKDGKGQELAILLSPTTEPLSFRDEGPLQDLGGRLAFGARRFQMSSNEMSAAAELNVCEMPRLRSEIGERTTLVVNGLITYRDYAFSSLCSWRVSEVELVEFGRDVCADVTRSLEHLLNVNCQIKGRSTPRSTTTIVPTSYVVIWEKK
ncbi:MAG: carboxypeptidase-like regulatory domain-containing protein [bacterium]